MAAGAGTRFGGPKQYAPMLGRRVIDWSIEAARSVADGVVLVVSPDRTADPEPGVDMVVAGAATRSGSVRAGLAAVPDEAEVIVVHDGARPLADHGMFRAVVDAVVAGADAVVPVIEVVDTITDVHGAPVDRSLLRAVQTPQAFAARALRAVHRTEPEATDDATLVVGAGGRLRQISGDRWNLKITEPEDLAVAECLKEMSR